MKRTGILWLLLVPFFWSSCRTDFDTVKSSGNLEFSRDTIFLDTIFTDIGSSTYNLKVYNPGKEDINIPQVKLQQGSESKYRLNVDGMAGWEFSRVEIPARDSIFIFIETTLDIKDLTEEDNQFLYTDAIEFDVGEHQQTVPLITLVKDAVFLYPRKYENGSTETIQLGMTETGEELVLEGFYLEEDELLFTNEKPYVIYGYATVPPEKTLVIEPGARIHFHDNSGLIVSEKASLKANGGWSEDRQQLENEIIFEENRLEPRYSDIPGQWGAIWLREGSINNSISNTTIKNGTIGLWADGNSGAETPPLFLRNIQIYNSSSIGLLAKNANITAENLAVNNSGQFSLHISLGGKYTFKHSTFANYWQQGYRQTPTVFIENTTFSSDQIYTSDLVQADFFNCIIYGNRERELYLSKNEAAAFEFKFKNSLIKFQEGENGSSNTAPMDFTDTTYFSDCVFNEDPSFRNPQQNDLRLSEDSPALNAGDRATALEVPLDILGIPRTGAPDLGAYEKPTLGAGG